VRATDQQGVWLVDLSPLPVLGLQEAALPPDLRGDDG
jgi:hypothetical protein